MSKKWEIFPNFCGHSENLNFNEEPFHSFVLNFQIVNVDSTEALNDDELNEKINDTTMQGDVANTDEINSDKEDPGSPKVKPAMPEVNIHKLSHFQTLVCPWGPTRACVHIYHVKQGRTSLNTRS